MSGSFDETDLVLDAGLLPAAVQAQRIDLGGLIESRLHLASHGTNGGAKALTMIRSCSRRDSIDDVAVPRAGAASSLFDGTRAPAPAATTRPSRHEWSDVRQLDAISRDLLARLWAAGAGWQDLTAT